MKHLRDSHVDGSSLTLPMSLALALSLTVAVPAVGCGPTRHLEPGTGASYSAVFEAQRGAAKSKKKKKKKGKPMAMGAHEATGTYQSYLDSFGGGGGAMGVKDDTAAWNALAQQAQSGKGSSIKLGK